MRSMHVGNALIVLTALVLACGSGKDEAQPTGGRQSPSQVATAHPAIEFPEKLHHSALGLTVDSDGRLWELFFPGPNGIDFDRYDPGSGQFSDFSVSANIGQFDAAVIRIDGRGHIIVGQGTAVVDFDPTSQASHAYEVPGHVSAMEVAGQVVYVASRSLASISTVDLQSGSVGQLALNEQFYGVEDIAIVGTILWVSTGFNDDRSAARQTGYLDLETREFRRFPVQTISLEAGPDGALAIQPSPPQILRLTVNGAQPLTATPIAGLDDALTNLAVGPDILALDARGHIVYTTNLVAGTLVRVDLVGEEARAYQLPIERIGVECPSDEAKPCARTAEVGWTVNTLGVSQSGDLFFSDLQRGIGLLHGSE